MALLDRFVQKRGAQIGNLILDATTSEVHRRTNRVTDHPVEEGASVSDHIQRMPEELELTGIVSDTPVIWLATLFATSPVVGDLDSSSARSDIAYKEIHRMMDAGELFTVITRLREYKNMSITSFTVSRDASTGNVIPISLSMREVLTVETATVAAPTPDASADAAPVDVGKKTPKPAASQAETTTQTSSLWSLAN